MEGWRVDGVDGVWGDGSIAGCKSCGLGVWGDFEEAFVAFDGGDHVLYNTGGEIVDERTVLGAVPEKISRKAWLDLEGYSAKIPYRTSYMSLRTEILERSAS